jgi:hypothetical protein
MNFNYLNELKHKSGEYRNQIIIFFPKFKNNVSSLINI